MGPPMAFTSERNEAVDCVGMADTEDSAMLSPALTEQSTLLRVSLKGGLGLGLREC